MLHEQLTDMRGEQMEVRSLVLSIVALIFLPLTFITGAMGMNVPVPGQDNPQAFNIIMGICALITVGVAVYFARIHWLKR